MTELEALIAELRAAGAGGAVDRLTNRAAEALDAFRRTYGDHPHEFEDRCYCGLLAHEYFEGMNA